MSTLEKTPKPKKDCGSITIGSEDKKRYVDLPY
jgi:hypothetical protein